MTPRSREDDAAPRIRQYLEYILHDVIDKCRIPVPMDLAFGDERSIAGYREWRFKMPPLLHAGDCARPPAYCQQPTARFSPAL